MERLTKIDGVGKNELIRCYDCGPEKAGENLEHCGYCEEGWQKALDRLAAYEDTGLEPEQVKRWQDVYNEILTRTYGPFHQKIADWLKAEEEGRLVVPPCKVGDTLFDIYEAKANGEGDVRDGSKVHFAPKIAICHLARWWTTPALSNWTILAPGSGPLLMAPLSASTPA